MINHTLPDYKQIDRAAQVSGRGLPRTQWMFAGQICTLQEFANLIWPTEHPDKMLFLLTHSGSKNQIHP